MKLNNMNLAEKLDAVSSLVNHILVWHRAELSQHEEAELRVMWSESNLMRLTHKTGDTTVKACNLIYGD